MKKILIISFALSLFVQTNNVFAFGKEGHQLVAEIGYDLLDTSTQRIVSKYLGDISVADAGPWMDMVRSNPKYKHMSSWHFINIDEGKSYEPSDDHNIVNEINAAIENLHNRENLSDSAVMLNILVLFHLIGDIAQPLHVGYGSDLGGNKVTVKYFGQTTNLHKVWDSKIIETMGIDKQACIQHYAGISEEEKREITVSDPVIWLMDSRKYLEQVYNYTNGTIDQSYVDRNAPIIEKQILYAGMRLAGTLFDIFNPHLVHPKDTIILEHTYFTSHFVNSAHIPWVVEYTLRKSDVNCDNPIKRSNKFRPDPLNVIPTDIDKDYRKSGYDRGHNMPAADNGCNGKQAMTDCFYFSNMFPQTGRLNRGVWKSLEVQERDMALSSDSIYVWIGSYGVAETIGDNKVVVPEYCWKVIYNYNNQKWFAYIFPNTETVSGKPEDFATTVDDIQTKSGFVFK